MAALALTLALLLHSSEAQLACHDKGNHGVWCPKGGDWFCVKNCPSEEEKQELKPDTKGCYDKGEYGVWCPKDGDWFCVKNCLKEEEEEKKKELKPDAKGCYDKGEYGVWCPKDGNWFCVKNCPEKQDKKELKFDAKGCHDKGVYGVWCSKDGDWFCINNCPKEQEKKGRKPDAKGCYDKGEHGVWCPKNGGWFCIKNCPKKQEKKEMKPDAKGCYDKGEHGVWCPKNGDWSCIKNCPKEEKKELKPDAKGCYDKGEHGVWCPKNGHPVPMVPILTAPTTPTPPLVVAHKPILEHGEGHLAELLQERVADLHAKGTKAEGPEKPCKLKKKLLAWAARAKAMLKKHLPVFNKEAVANKDKEDAKDCFFDKECHAMVDWKRVAMLKRGFFARLQHLKEHNDKARVPVMMKKLHHMFAKAGMPDDRINYILEKWVRFVYPEALQNTSEVVII